MRNLTQAITAIAVLTLPVPAGAQGTAAFDGSRPEHHHGGVNHNHDHQPAHDVERHLANNIGRDQDTRNSAQSQA